MGRERRKDPKHRLILSLGVKRRRLLKPKTPRTPGESQRHRSAGWRPFLGSCIRRPQDAARGRLNDLTVDFLMELLEKQEYRCALTRVPMVHITGDLCAASVDRINSAGSHTQDNVQLVCRFVNTAKGNHPCADFTAMMDLLISHYGKPETV